MGSFRQHLMPLGLASGEEVAQRGGGLINGSLRVHSFDVPVQVTERLRQRPTAIDITKFIHSHDVSHPAADAADSGTTVPDPAHLEMSAVDLSGLKHAKHLDHGGMFYVPDVQ